VGRHKQLPKPAGDREFAMKAMYEQGLTLIVIGEKFGVSRERVRQLLVKHFGMSAESGGQSVVAECKRQDAAAQRNARKLAKWGVSFSEWREYCDAGLTAAFIRQRRNAQSRGIPFRLNLKQWVTVWQASGKLDQRGRGKGCYCMSRIKDDGAYELGNVHIQSNSENGREATKQWIGKEKQNTGVFLLYPGLKNPWFAKVGKVRLGLFPTEEAAVQARRAYCVEHGLPVSGSGLGSGRGWTLKPRSKTRPYQVQVKGTKATYHATQEEAEAEYRRRSAEVLAARAQLVVVEA
jgi:hypothetical protein